VVRWARTHCAPVPPVSSRSCTTSRGAATTCGIGGRASSWVRARAGRPTQPPSRLGALAVHQPSKQLLAGRPPDLRAARLRRRYGHQRHRRQERLLLRPRQQRDHPQRGRRRAHGRHQLRHGVLVRRVCRIRSVGPGRPRIGPLPRCKPGGRANLSAGTFYKGAIVSGYPSDPTDNAVQANIVAAGYR
jgi:hypothetical protein